MDWNEVNFFIDIKFNGGNNVGFNVAFNRTQPDPENVTENLDVDFSSILESSCVQSIKLSASSDARIHFKNVQQSLQIISDGETIEKAEFELETFTADQFFIDGSGIKNVRMSIKRTPNVGNPNFLQLCETSGSRNMALSIPLIVISIILSINLSKWGVNFSR